MFTMPIPHPAYRARVAMMSASHSAVKLAALQTDRIARALGELGPGAHEAARRFLDLLGVPFTRAQQGMMRAG